MEKQTVVTDGGGKQFALQIAAAIYDSQLAFDWDVAQLSFELGNCFQNLLTDGGSRDAVRRSEIESIWRQIAWAYDALQEYAATAMGFVSLASLFEHESSAHLGMKVRFQREFEGFLFRLFSLRERLFHLSNVYHCQGLTRRQIRGDYWTRLRQNGVDDEFARTVEAFLSNRTVAKWLQLRHDMTHNFELALVGIGWAPVSQLKDENEELVDGIAIGATYDGSVEFTQAVSELQFVFEAITAMLRKLDALLLANFAPPVGKQVVAGSPPS